MQRDNLAYSIKRRGWFSHCSEISSSFFLFSLLVIVFYCRLQISDCRLQKAESSDWSWGHYSLFTYTYKGEPLTYRQTHTEWSIRWEERKWNSSVLLDWAFVFVGYTIWNIIWPCAMLPCIIVVHKMIDDKMQK